MEIAPPRVPGRIYAANSASGNARVQYGDIHGNVTYNVYEIRQERIGIEASISGLRSLTESIHTQLLEFRLIEYYRTELFADLTHEVTASKTSLDAFNHKLSWLHASPEQAALVRLDRLVILLANAIVLFDRLRSSLDGAPAAGDDGLSSFLPRLREHNMAWKLQLELMNRHTENESDFIASSLDDATNKLLRENADLKRRMEAFQTQLDQISMQLNDSGASMRPGTIRTVKGQICDVNTDADTIDDSASVHSVATSFEKALNRSWVYRRNQHRSEVMSIGTSLLRDYAWSEISELTLANKSALSVLALPINISELAHRSWYQSHARAPNLPTISEEEIDVDALVKQGKPGWEQLSDDQIVSVTNQLMQKEGFHDIPATPLQVYMKRIRDAARRFGLHGKPIILERDISKILGDQDYRSLKKCWENYDPRSTMFISKEAFSRLMGDLPDSFGFRVYPQYYRLRNLFQLQCKIEGTIPKILSTKESLERLGEKDCAFLLNRRLLELPIDEIRRRRREMQTLYTEVMMAADPDRGIPFMTLFIICARWRDNMFSFRQENLTTYLGRRVRSKRVQEETNRQRIVGLFDMLYWSRRFRQYQRQRVFDRMASITDAPIAREFETRLGMKVKKDEDLMLDEQAKEFREYLASPTGSPNARESETRLMMEVKKGEDLALDEHARKFREYRRQRYLDRKVKKDEDLMHDECSEGALETVESADDDEHFEDALEYV